MLRISHVYVTCEWGSPRGRDPGKESSKPQVAMELFHPHEIHLRVKANGELLQAQEIYDLICPEEFPPQLQF